MTRPKNYMSARRMPDGKIIYRARESTFDSLMKYTLLEFLFWIVYMVILNLLGLVFVVFGIFMAVPLALTIQGWKSEFIAKRSKKLKTQNYVW